MGCVWTLLAQQPWMIASGCWRRGRRLPAAACVRASLDANHSLQMEMRWSLQGHRVASPQHRSSLGANLQVTWKGATGELKHTVIRDG